MSQNCISRDKRNQGLPRNRRNGSPVIAPQSQDSWQTMCSVKGNIEEFYLPDQEDGRDNSPRVSATTGNIREGGIAPHWCGDWIYILLTRDSTMADKYKTVQS